MTSAFDVFVMWVVGGDMFVVFTSAFMLCAEFERYCSSGDERVAASSPWPTEDECVEVPTCFKTNFPTPEASKLFKALSQSLYSEGESIYFECSDPNAILDDNSGRNFFPLECKGDDVLGYYQNILVEC